MTGEEVNAVRRELERLKEIGLLKTEERGNRLYYLTRKEFPFFYELLRMVGKTTGIGAEVIEKQEELGKPKFVTISLRFVEGQPPEENDIDVMFVGRFELDRVQDLVRRHEEMIEGEINYTILSEEEFDYRKSRGDAFIRTVLTQPHIVLVGDEGELHK